MRPLPSCFRCPAPSAQYCSQEGGWAGEDGRLRKGGSSSDGSSKAATNTCIQRKGEHGRMRTLAWQRGHQRDAGGGKHAPRSGRSGRTGEHACAGREPVPA